MEPDQVYFAGNELSTIVGASLIDHDFNSLPNRVLNMHKLARANKSILTSAEYSDKEATVNFHLRGCDRGEAEAVLETLKSYLRPINSQLIVLQAERELTFDGATLNEINYKWFSNKIIITLVFTIADPIGYEDTSTTLLNVTVTSSASSNPIDNLGSFDAEPTINVLVTTVTGGSAQSMSLKNEETGQGITITRTWANSDTIEINSALKTVTVNGANTDYTGQFPTFPPGNGSLGYTDTFTTRSVDITATYNKTYI